MSLGGSYVARQTRRSRNVYDMRGIGPQMREVRTSPADETVEVGESDVTVDSDSIPTTHPTVRPLGVGHESQPSSPMFSPPLPSPSLLIEQLRRLEAQIPVRVCF